VGLISPLIVVPKILLQKIWQLGVHWNESLPIEIENQWRDWAKSLIRLSEIKIPRHYYLGQPEVTKVELHFFSDASEKAYGTVCYLRSEDSTGHCRGALVGSRTRVAPIQRITLPRLELMGCFLSARLANSIKKALSPEIPCLF
jgi:Pao retrotransposon peptidase